MDISGWVIKGVGSSDGDWPIPTGTVIPKGGYVVFVSHDSDFRAAYPGNHFIGGQFPGGLSSTGEDIQLKRGGTVVDDVNYTPGTGGWVGPLPADRRSVARAEGPDADNPVPPTGPSAPTPARPTPRTPPSVAVAAAAAAPAATR